MPKYIIRLILVFAVFISLFLLAKKMLTPDSFGELGHYRADAIGEIQQLPAKYVESEVCIECHDDIGELKAKGEHAKISCSTCHGIGREHVDDPTIENIAKQNTREFCAKCHHLNEARAKVVVQVDVYEHNIEEKQCTACHNPHLPYENI